MQENKLTSYYPSCAHLCRPWFLGISNFLEETSSLSHSIVFLYFFALFTEEGFLISPSYSLELCIQFGTSFPFSLPFASLSFFFYLFVSPPQTTTLPSFAFLHFLFLGIILVTTLWTMLWTSIHSSSGTCLPELIPWIWQKQKRLRSSGKNTHFQQQN